MPRKKKEIRTKKATQIVVGKPLKVSIEFTLVPDGLDQRQTPDIADGIDDRLIVKLLSDIKEILQPIKMFDGDEYQIAAESGTIRVRIME